jgi:hypothetical protein
MIIINKTTNENITWNKTWILQMQIKKVREWILISKPMS